MTPRLIVTFIAGLLFAIGLGVAGMTRADKVLAFLDVTGHWDPSLAFVMIGAIGVFFTAWRVRLGRSRPLLARHFPELRREHLDGRLILGAALFGVGWGLAGYCPGPALVSLVSGTAPAIIFVATMLASSWLVRSLDRAPAACE